MPPMRILLVDDHILFRKGLASLLDSQADFEVVGEAGDGFEGLEKAKMLKPDLILMDVTMPRCSGPEATRLIVQQIHGAQIVMLTVSDDDVDLFAAIRAGAMGYLLKSIKPDELFTHLRGLAQGEAPISRLMAAKLLREFARSSSEPPMPSMQVSSAITDREQEVLNLIARGLTNREIGEKLHIAENTVKNHVRSILDKLHLANRAQAAAYAVQSQIRQDQS
jgi:two-component system nitrate/nitrite response regulator NarL